MISERRDMGTTLTAGIVYEDRMIIAHTGDSRAYLIRDGEVEQVTQDHSWVAEQVSMGALTLQQAQMSPFRNIITRSIGTQPTVDPDFYSIDLQEGDRVLMCSDGLTAHVEPEDLQNMVASKAAIAAGPSLTAMKLVEVANERGGRDNITVLILDVLEIEPLFGDEDSNDEAEEPLKLLSEDENAPAETSSGRGRKRSLFGSKR
jgi:serine/threonine protein phosphatase PrpC